MAKKNPKDIELLKKVGEKVREIRNEKGLTMVQLAEKCDVEYTTISKLERGLLNATVALIQKVAKGLEVPIQDILKEF